MQLWRSIEKVFTVETIMTPRDAMLVWDGISDISVIWEQANAHNIDLIPVMENGGVIGFLYKDDGQVHAIPNELAIAGSASMPELIHNFSKSQQFLLFVYAEKAVVGIVTQADLNKMPARTYFYNISAEFEILVAKHIAQRKFSNEVIFGFIKPTETRLQDIYTRTSDPKYGLKTIYALYISELVKIIAHDSDLQKQLGFRGIKHVEKQLNGLVHLRNDIVHPNNFILNANRDIDKLKQYVEYILSFLDTYTLA